MVSTRQMSITTSVPDIGTVNTGTSNTTNRNCSPNVSQQNLTIAIQPASSSTRHQHAMHSNNNGTNSCILLQHKSKQLSLQDMPFEILDKILSYVSYKQVSNMRLVSKQMNQCCISILNSTFSKLQTQLMKRFENIKKVMPRRESARRSHPLSNECDIIETCCMRLSLLQMAFGRYIEHKHCCFFPGAILDEIYNVMNFIQKNPNLGRPYKVTEELIDLSTMAMEYFKDHIESTLPQFGFFSKNFFGGKNSQSKSTATPNTRNCYLFENSSLTTSAKSGQSNSMPSPPQSNMVLRKGIRKIKQGMKKYNNQLTVLRSDLRYCKRKSTDQTKQITELQSMLADQQKQTLEYANRLDENDKKSEEMSRKISTLLQELNKCKIELHYWRSKSPATPICNNCGQTTLSNIPQPNDLITLVNKIGEKTVGCDLNEFNLKHNEQNNDTSMIDLIQTAFSQSKTTLINNSNENDKMDIIKTPTTINNKISIQSTDNNNSAGQSSTSICTVGTPRFYGKRKADELTSFSAIISASMTTPIAIDDNASIAATNNVNQLQSKIINLTSTTSTGNIYDINDASYATNRDVTIGTISTNNITNSNISDNSNKKARRVQNKFKCQSSNINIKTRNK